MCSHLRIEHANRLCESCCGALLGDVRCCRRGRTLRGEEESVSAATSCGQVRWDDVLTSSDRARQSPVWILLRGTSRRREVLQARTHLSGCRRVCLGGDGLRLGHAGTMCARLRVGTRQSPQRVLLRGASWRHESSRMRTRSFGAEDVLRLAGAKCGVRHAGDCGPAYGWEDGHQLSPAAGCLAETRGAL